MTNSLDYQSSLLVTGGTGVLGSYLLKKLCEEGYQNVFAIKRKNSQLASVRDLPVKWIDADILDIGDIEEAVEGKEVVIHCAGLVSFVPADKRKLHLINVTGTRNLINCCLKSSVSRFIHISSVAALGRAIYDDKSVDEGRIWKETGENTTYGLTKHLAELEVWRGNAEGLNTVILCPSLILGFGNYHRSSNKMLDHIAKGVSFYPPGRTGYVDVRDVVNVIIECIKNRSIKGRYLVNGFNMKIREFLDRLATRFGNDKPDKKLNTWMAKVLIYLEKIRSTISGNRPVITRESVRNAMGKIEYENSKVKRELNYSFYSPEETMDFIVEKYRLLHVKN